MVNEILFKIIVLGNLSDFHLELSLIDYSMYPESLNYQEDRFAKRKATDELFINQYLEKGFTIFHVHFVSINETY